MQLHTISDTVLHAMEDRIARALNRLSEDADLSADTDSLLNLLDNYFDDDNPLGKIPPSTHIITPQIVHTQGAAPDKNMSSFQLQNSSSIIVPVGVSPQPSRGSGGMPPQENFEI